MTGQKTIGLILLIFFIIVLGFITWTLTKFFTDPGPTDGPGYGIMMIVLFLLGAYYFTMTIWTWRLFRRADHNVTEIGIQYTLVFVFGILTPGLLYIFL